MQAIGYAHLSASRRRCAPGAEFDFGFTASISQQKGFTNSGQHRSWSHNGTFFNNLGCFPRSATSAGARSQRPQRAPQARPRRTAAHAEAGDARRARPTPTSATTADWIDFADARSAPRPTRSRWRPATCSANGATTAVATSTTRWTRRSCGFCAYLSARWEVKRRPLERRRDRGLLRPRRTPTTSTA